MYHSFLIRVETLSLFYPQIIILDNNTVVLISNQAFNHNNYPMKL